MSTKIAGDRAGFRADSSGLVVRPSRHLAQLARRHGYRGKPVQRRPGPGYPADRSNIVTRIPQGLAVAMSLCATRLSAGKAALVTIGSGLIEPVCAIIGLAASSGFAWSYPVSTGVAAGATIFVVSHEVIAETHATGIKLPPCWFKAGVCRHDVH